MIQPVQARTQQSDHRVLERTRAQERDRRDRRAILRGKCRCVAALILIVAGACGRENSQRAEAQALLARISKLALDAPAEVRAEGIRQLRALPLTNPRLVHTRDQCALAHAGLLAAELEQAQVRARMDAAEKKASQVDKAELESIAAALAHATASLKEGQAALPECERATRALAMKYR